MTVRQTSNLLLEQPAEIAATAIEHLIELLSNVVGCPFSSLVNLQVRTRELSLMPLKHVIVAIRVIQTDMGVHSRLWDELVCGCCHRGVVAAIQLIIVCELDIPEQLGKLFLIARPLAIVKKDLILLMVGLVNHDIVHLRF